MQHSLTQITFRGQVVDLLGRLETLCTRRRYGSESAAHLAAKSLAKRNGLNATDRFEISTFAEAHSPVIDYASIAPYALRCLAGGIGKVRMTPTGWQFFAGDKADGRQRRAAINQLARLAFPR